MSVLISLTSSAPRSLQLLLMRVRAGHGFPLLTLPFVGCHRMNEGAISSGCRTQFPGSLTLLTATLLATRGRS